MRKTFDDIVQQVNEFSFVMEDAINLLKNTPQNFKLKKKIETAFKSISRAIERHEALITDAVPPMIVNTSPYAKEFVETWKIYKDYMLEQYGIRMGSRMQVFRLKLLAEYSNDDFQLAKKWLEYYMANGSANIYPVNQLKLDEKDDTNTKPKAGFSLPSQITG
jgi:hypothetical protein